MLISIVFILSHAPALTRTLTLRCVFLVTACEIQVNEKEWDGVRRKYWHGRDVYYLPIVTWNNSHIVKEHFQNAQASIFDQSQKRGINAASGGDEQDSKKLKPHL
jgi:hypothetical protein